MANPGVGYRTVNSVALEISFHLLQPIVNTTLTSSVTAGAGVTAHVGSTANMYAGALLVIGTEVVTVSSVPSTTTFVATFASSHVLGAVIQTATLPLQTETDALFSQSEMLGYITRAQNQFLFDVPCVYQITTSSVAFGKLIQSSPANMIEINRIAAQNVTGTWSRLYELTQEELTMQNPVWRSQHITKLSSWFEDRTGNYQWGVNGLPASTFPVEILSSMRDSDALALTDGFLVPDPFLHFVKWLALHYAWSKNGEAANPLLAGYALMRYQRGVGAVRRWMEAAGLTMGVDTNAAPMLAAAGGRRG